MTSVIAHVDPLTPREDVVTDYGLVTESSELRTRLLML